MKFLLLAFAFLLTTCVKERSFEFCQDGKGAVDAQIIYTGPVATDGCDWVVRVGTDQDYHPDILPEAFKEDGIAVKICFTLTSDQFHCGLTGAGMPVIHVLNIRK